MKDEFDWNRAMAMFVTLLYMAWWVVTLVILFWSR